MSAAPATSYRATAPDATEPVRRDVERGRLLGLVRRLIEYGRDLVATLQARNTPDPPLDVAHSFGGVTLALIIARITRGLMIAAAFEKRLLHPATCPSRKRTRRASTTWSRRSHDPPDVSLIPIRVPGHGAVLWRSRDGIRGEAVSGQRPDAPSPSR